MTADTGDVKADRPAAPEALVISARIVGARQFSLVDANRTHRPPARLIDCASATCGCGSRGSHTIELLSSDGSVLERNGIAVGRPTNCDPAPGAAVSPAQHVEGAVWWNPETAQVVIRDEIGVLLQRNVAEGAAPRVGEVNAEVRDDHLHITWTEEPGTVPILRRHLELVSERDPDIRCRIPIASTAQQPSALSIPLGELPTPAPLTEQVDPPPDTFVVAMTATDGFLMGSAASAAFTLPLRAFRLRILLPLKEDREVKSNIPLSVVAVVTYGNNHSPRMPLKVTWDIRGPGGWLEYHPPASRVLGLVFKEAGSYKVRATLAPTDGTPAWVQPHLGTASDDIVLTVT